jgi:hypothetical protein
MLCARLKEHCQNTESIGSLECFVNNVELRTIPVYEMQLSGVCLVTNLVFSAV